MLACAKKVSIHLVLAMPVRGSWLLLGIGKVWVKSYDCGRDVGPNAHIGFAVVLCALHKHWDVADVADFSSVLIVSFLFSCGVRFFAFFCSLFSEEHGSNLN